jgi:hypothetical protein
MDRLAQSQPQFTIKETVDNNDFAMGTGEDGRRNKNKSLGPEL